MWIGLFLTVILGLFLLFLIYILMYNNCDFEFYMTQREFRHKILGEEYDDVYSYGSYFNTPISEEGKNKYQKYLEKCEAKSKRRKVFFYSLPVVIYIILIFAFSSLGAFIEKQNLNREVARYEASKYTIEMSLENADLTGLERIELVKQASEKNEWLAQKKYEVQQWYRFYLDKDYILKLEPIKLTK